MNNGKIIHSKNHTVKIFPASLVKIATLYVTFKELKNGRIKMNDRVFFSKKATSMSPSKIGIPLGESMSVHDAILSLIIKSANDVAVALAEHIAKDEDTFCKIMNFYAKKIGMKNTVFKNASGWHHKDQKTTAVDLARLAIAIYKDFPEYYTMFSKSSFLLNGQVINGHNKVVEVYEGAEGMKTGYTQPAGYNLVTTAKRGDKRLVGVVLGQSSSVIRNQKMMDLLDYAFKNNRLFSDNVHNHNQKGRNIDKKIWR